MVNVKKLKEEELNQLNKKENVVWEEDEVSLEELILLGENKKIPIHIEYPLPDETTKKAKAFIKQLTMKEIEGIKQNDNTSAILQKALFKSNGDPFTPTQIKKLPIGVVNALLNKIFEVSGVDPETLKQLQDF